MIKLLNILKEIVEGKAIEVPPSELNKIDKLYDYIVDNFENLQKSTEGKKWNQAISDTKFKGYFAIQPINGPKLLINVAFYNDPSDTGKARALTQRDVSKINLDKKQILINLGQQIQNKDQFKQDINHELIHAIDPKTSRSDLYNKAALGKKGILLNLPKNPREKYDLYAKQSHEFDAFAGSIIQTIKDKLGSTKDESKKEIIYTFFSDLKNKNLEDVIKEKYKKQIMDVLGSSNDENYKQTADFLQIYMKDDKLSRKLLQMLASANVIKTPSK